MKEKRREKMKGRMKEKMKRDETKLFFQKNVSRPSNPPDELAQHVSKKILFRRIIPPLFCKSAESGRFFFFFEFDFLGPGN